MRLLEVMNRLFVIGQFPFSLLHPAKSLVHWYQLGRLASLHTLHYLEGVLVEGNRLAVGLLPCLQPE